MDFISFYVCFFDQYWIREWELKVILGNIEINIKIIAHLLTHLESILITLYS